MAEARGPNPVDVREGVARIVHRAVAAAPVAGDRVAVVARLTGIDVAIAADPHIHARLSWREARVAVFDLADTGATIARDRVAVVAHLAQLDVAVAADGRLLVVASALSARTGRAFRWLPGRAAALVAVVAGRHGR